MKEHQENNATQTADELRRLEVELERAEKRLAELERLYRDASLDRDTLASERDELKKQLDCISNSGFWRVTKPFRKTLDAIKRLVAKIFILRSAIKFLKYVKHHGFRAAVRKSRKALQDRRRLRRASDHNGSTISAKQRAAEQKTVFEKKVLFSIIVPLYNTPLQFLREMIGSVTAQTYGNWELCMADGSDDAHPEVEAEVRRLMAKEPRIKYRKLEKNLGISGNTNACLDMAKGDYIALFDHDDVLHPSALFEMMKAICEKDADFVYTDENTFSKKPSAAYCPHYKPDFSPDLLRSYNYICHFVSFKRELMEKVGQFRSEFDGSQDYDMILRLTEQAERIVHIPRILYFWRSHANSVASDISAKPYTLVAAKKALAEHLERVGLKGEVLDSRIPSTYRIRYAVEGEPKVSIIIPNMDHAETLKTCIDSVEKRTTYDRRRPLPTTIRCARSIPTSAFCAGSGNSTIRESTILRRSRPRATICCF